MSGNPQAVYGQTRLTAIVTDPPWYENCFIVQDVPSGEQIIVDPGNNAQDILAEVRAAGGPVKEILLTHGHPDHIGAVRALQDVLGVPCRAHKDEAALLNQISAYALRRLGMTVESPLSVDYFADDAPFALGGKPFQMIPTPGHTPGGVCYSFADGFALTGDSLFNHGIGRTDLPGGDGAQLGRSLTHLLAVLPAEWEVHCGHGPGWTVAEARPWWAAMAESWS